MSDTVFLEILLGVLVIICAIITNAALWPTPPRSHATVSHRTVRSLPPSGGPGRGPGRGIERAADRVRLPGRNPRSDGVALGAGVSSRGLNGGRGDDST